MIAVSDCFFDSRARLGSPFWALDSFAESFVVRVEVEKEVFGVDAITGLVSLEDSLKEPRRMTDVPPRRAHEIGCLDDVVFDFERRHDLHRACSDLCVEVRNRDGTLP